MQNREQEYHAKSQETLSPHIKSMVRAALAPAWACALPTCIGTTPHHRYDRVLHWPLGEVENHNMDELRDIACPGAQLSDEVLQTL